MRIIKRYNENTIRNIVDRVLKGALREAVGYEAPMGLEELKDALIGKHLFIKTIDTTGRNNWSVGLGEQQTLEGDIVDVEDITERDPFEEDYKEVSKEQGTEYEPADYDLEYRIVMREAGNGRLFDSDVLDFSPRELTSLATRRRLYRNGGDYSDWGGPDETYLRWIFEIR